MRSIAQRCLRKIERSIKVTRTGQLKKFAAYLPYVRDKIGLEIGGPSDVFREGSTLPIYGEAQLIDNCDFSGVNVWGQHSQDFLFSSRKPPGKTILSEGSALTEVADSSYDFVLSSHNLEHFANPVKALKEWQRVLKAGGALILALPHYKDTFDHRRSPTAVEHMLADYQAGVGEDDLTHLPEILDKHDLSQDLPAGSKEDFRKRSLENFKNRCLHHHVFDLENSRALLSVLGFDVISQDDIISPHILILAQTTCS